MPDLNPEQQNIISQLQIALSVSGIQDVQASINEIIRSEKEALYSAETLSEKYGSLDNAIKELVKRHKERNREVSKSKEEISNISKSIVGYGVLAGAVHEVTGAMKQMVIPRSFGAAIEQTIEYNKSLLQTSASVNRLGIGLSYLENSLKATASSVSLTRQETANLFNQFQEGMRFVSLQQFENILKRVRNIVGANADAIGKMQQSLSDISQEYPSLAMGLADLARAGSSLDRVEKNSLQNRIRSLYFIGQISDAQYKQISAYISGNNQLSASDKQRQAEMQSQIKLVQEYKRQTERIGLFFGQNILKGLQLAIDHMERLNNGTASWSKTITIAAASVAATVIGVKTAANVIGGITKYIGVRTLQGVGLGALTEGGRKGALGGAAAGVIAGATGQAIDVRVINPQDFAIAGALSGKGSKSPGTVVTPVAGGGKPSAYTSYIGGVKSRMPSAMKSVGIGIGLEVASMGLKYGGDKLEEAGHERLGGGAQVLGSLTNIGGKTLMGAGIGTALIPIPVVGTAIGAAVGTLIGTVGEWKVLTQGLKNALPQVFGPSEKAKAAGVPEAFTAEVNKYKDEEKKMSELNNQIEKAKKSDVAEMGKIGVGAVYNSIKSQLDDVEKLLKESTDSVYDKISENIKISLPNVNIEFKQGETKEKAIADFLDRREKEIGAKREILATQRSKMEPSQIKNIEEMIKKEEDEIKAIEKIVDKEKESDDTYKQRINSLTELQARLEQINTVHRKQLDIVSAINSVVQVQSSYVDELIQKMSMTGKIDVGMAFDAIQDGLNYLELEISAQKELLSLLESTNTVSIKQLMLKKGINAAQAQYLQGEADAKGDILEASARDKIRIDAEKTIQSLTRQRTEQVQKATGMYDDQLKLMQSTAQRASLLVELADNYAISVGASVQQRLNAYQAEQKNIEVLKQKRVVAQMELSKLIEGTDENLRQKAKIVDIENEILSAQIKQAQGVKSMRDAWISAMSAMNTGMEGFSEIVMNAEQNTAQIQRLDGAVRSMASGARATRDAFGNIVEDVGYRTSEIMNQFGEISSKGGRDMNELPYLTSIEKKLGFTRAGGVRSMMESSQRGAVTETVNTIQRQAEVPVRGGLEALSIGAHEFRKSTFTAGTDFQKDITSGATKAGDVISAEDIRRQKNLDNFYKSDNVFSAGPDIVTVGKEKSPAKDKEEENWFKAIEKAPKGTLPRMVVNEQSQAIPVFVVNLADIEKQSTPMASKVAQSIREPITRREQSARSEATREEKPESLSVKIQKIESVRDLFKNNDKIDIATVLSTVQLNEEGKAFLKNIKEAGQTTLSIEQFEESIVKMRQNAVSIEKGVLAAKEDALKALMEDINRVEATGAKAVMKRQQAAAIEQDIDDSRNELDALLSGRTKKMLTMGRKTMTDKMKEFMIQKKMTTLSGVTYNMMKLQSGVFMRKLFSTDMLKSVLDFDWGKVQGKVEEEISDNPLKVHYKNFTKEITRIADEVGLPPDTILTYYKNFTKEIYRIADEFDLPPEKVATYYSNFSEEFNRIAEQFGIPSKRVPEILFGFTEEVVRKAELAEKPPRTVEEYIINYTKSLERMAVKRGLFTGDLVVQFKGVVAGLKSVEREVKAEGLTTGDLIMTYSGDEAYRDKFVRTIKARHPIPEEAEVVYRNIVNKFESSLVYPNLPPDQVPVFLRDFIESFTQSAAYKEYVPKTVDGEIKGAKDYIEQYVQYGIMPPSIIDGQVFDALYKLTQNVKYKKVIPSEVLVEFFGARDKFISKIVEDGAPPAIVPQIFTGWRHMVETKIEIKQNPFDQITEAFNNANEGVKQISQDLQLAIERASGRIGISGKKFVIDYGPIFETVEEVSDKSKLRVDEIFDSFGRMSGIISSIEAPKIDVTKVRQVKQTLYVQSSEIFDSLNSQIKNLEGKDVKIVFDALPDVVEMISKSDPKKPVDLDTSELPEKIKTVIKSIPEAKGVYTEFAKVVNIPIIRDNLNEVQTEAYYEGVKKIVVPLPTKVIGDPGTAMLKFPDKLIEVLLKTEFENKPEEARFVIDDFKKIYKIAYDLQIPPSIQVETKDKIQMESSQRPSLVIKNLDDTINIKLKETDFGRKIIDISDKTNQSVSKVMSNFKYLTDRISKISLTNGEPFEDVLDDAIRFSHKFDERVSKFGEKWKVDPNRIKTIRQAVFDTSDKLFSIFEDSIKKLPVNIPVPAIVDNIPDTITMVAKNPDIGKDQLYNLLLSGVPEEIVANIKEIPEINVAIEQFKKTVLLPIDENKLTAKEASAYTESLTFFVSDENISKKMPLVDMLFDLNKLEVPLKDVSVILEGEKEIYENIGGADIRISTTPTVVLQKIAESFVTPNVKVPTKEIKDILESLASSFKIIDETDKKDLAVSFIDLRNGIEKTAKQFGLSIGDITAQFNALRATDPFRKIDEFGDLIKTTFDNIEPPNKQLDEFSKTINSSASNILTTIQKQIVSGLPPKTVKVVIEKMPEVFKAALKIQEAPEEYNVVFGNLQKDLKIDADAKIDVASLKEILDSVGRAMSDPVKTMYVQKDKIDEWGGSLMKMVTSRLNEIDVTNIKMIGKKEEYILDLTSLNSLVNNTLKNISSGLSERIDISKIDKGSLVKSISDINEEISVLSRNNIKSVDQMMDSVREYQSPDIRPSIDKVLGVIDDLATSIGTSLNSTDKNILLGHIVNLNSTMNSTSKKMGLSMQEVAYLYAQLGTKNPFSEIEKFGSSVKEAFKEIGLRPEKFNEFKDTMNLSAANVLSKISSQVEKGLIPPGAVKAIVGNIENLFDRSVDIKNIPDNYSVTLTEIKNELEVESQVDIDYTAVRDLMTSIGQSVYEPMRKMGAAKEKVDAWRHGLMSVVRENLEGIDDKNIETIGIRSKFILSLSSLDSLFEKTLEDLAKEISLTDIPSFDAGVFLNAINDFQNKYMEIIEKPQKMIEAAGGRGLPDMADPQMIWNNLARMFPEINNEIREASNDLKVDPSVIKDQFWKFYQVSKSFSDNAGEELSDYVDKVYRTSLAVEGKLTTLQKGIPSVDFDADLEYKAAYDQLNDFFNKLNYQSKNVNFSDFLKNFKDVYDAPEEMVANLQSFFVTMAKRTKTLESLSANQIISEDVIKTIKKSFAMEGIDSTPLISAIDRLGVFGDKVEEATVAMSEAKSAYEKISTSSSARGHDEAAKKLAESEKVLTESKNTYNNQMAKVVGALNHQLVNISSYETRQKRTEITKPEKKPQERNILGVSADAIRRLSSPIVQNKMPVASKEKVSTPIIARVKKEEEKISPLEIDASMMAPSKNEQDANNKLAQIQREKERLSVELDPLLKITSGITDLESKMNLTFAEPKEKEEAYQKGAALSRNLRAKKISKEQEIRENPAFKYGEDETLIDYTGPKPQIKSVRVFGTEEIKKMMEELHDMEKNPAYLYFVERKKSIEKSNRQVGSDIDKTEREIDAKFRVSESDRQTWFSKGEDVGNRIQDLNAKIKQAEEIRDKRLKQRLQETTNDVSVTDNNFIQYFGLFKELMKRTGSDSIKEADKKTKDILDKRQHLESMRFRTEGEKINFHAITAAKTSIRSEIGKPAGSPAEILALNQKNIEEREKENKKRIEAVEKRKEEFNKKYGVTIQQENILLQEERERNAASARTKSAKGQTVILDEETYPTLNSASAFLGKMVGINPYAVKIPGTEEIARDQGLVDKMIYDSSEKDDARREILYNNMLNIQQLKKDQSVSDASLMQSMIDRAAKDQENRKNLAQAINNLSPYNQEAFNNYDKLVEMDKNEVTMTKDERKLYERGKKIVPVIKQRVYGKEGEISPLLRSYYERTQSSGKDIFEVSNEMRDEELQIRMEASSAEAERVRILSDKSHEAKRRQWIDENKKQEEKRKSDENKIAMFNRDLRNRYFGGIGPAGSETPLGNIEKPFAPMPQEKLLPILPDIDKPTVSPIKVATSVKLPTPRIKPVMDNKSAQKIYDEFTSKFDEGLKYSEEPGGPLGTAGMGRERSPSEKRESQNRVRAIRERTRKQKQEAMGIIEGYEKSSGKSILQTIKETGITPDILINLAQKSKTEKGEFDYKKVQRSVEGYREIGKSPVAQEVVDSGWIQTGIKKTMIPQKPVPTESNIEKGAFIGTAMGAFAGPLGMTIGAAAGSVLNKDVFSSFSKAISSISPDTAKTAYGTPQIPAKVEEISKESVPTFVAPPMMAAPVGSTVTVVMENASFNVTLSSWPTNLASSAQEIAKQLQPQIEQAVVVAVSNSANSVASNYKS